MSDTIGRRRPAPLPCMRRGCRVCEQLRARRRCLLVALLALALGASACADPEGDLPRIIAEDCGYQMAPTCDYLQAADEVVFGQVLRVKPLTRSMLTPDGEGALRPIERNDCLSSINWGVEISLLLLHQRNHTIGAPTIDVLIGHHQAGAWDPFPSVVNLDGDDELEWVHVSEEGGAIEVGQGLGLSLIQVGDHFTPVGEPLFSISSGQISSQQQPGCMSPGSPSLGDDLDSYLATQCGTPSELALGRLEQKRSRIDNSLWTSSYCF